MLEAVLEADLLSMLEAVLGAEVEPLAEEPSLPHPLLLPLLILHLHLHLYLLWEFLMGLSSLVR